MLPKQKVIPESQTVQEKVEKAQNLLDELSHEDTHGFKIGDTKS